MNTNRHECSIETRRYTKRSDDSCRLGRSLALMATAVMLTGCCTNIATSVRNESGRDIQLTLIHLSQQTETVTIHAGSTGRCKGVIPSHPSYSPDSWIISDGQSRFIFSDVSPIATLPSPFVSRSRFTRDFPCNRVTRHVRITSNMTIHAARVIGYTKLEPAPFPISYTTKETIN